MMDFLSVVWNVDPVIVKIGPLAIRYYSLLFIAGFPLGYWLFTKFYTRAGLDTKILEPLLYALLIGTIVGARLGHCIFYQPDYYFTPEHFGEILQVWKGGLASHGGTVGVILALLWYARKYGRAYDFDTLWLFDRLAIAVCFAAFFIRMGNLFNSEIYGCETSLPWGFVFVRAGETAAKHPTQLYEAFSYLILGLVLLLVYLKGINKVHQGFFLGVFFIGCFGMRFLIEFIKEKQVDFEEGMALDMGQILSIPFILAGIYFVWYSISRKLPAERVPKAKTHYCPPPKSKRNDYSTK
ncbi:MAG: prolipoprotein diacylglyceryl transferase [Bacteroidales bacterium]|nr:prolipoprotein diacylglyceryl transferase [Candidatus Cacconaster equifaecalis]